MQMPISLTTSNAVKTDNNDFGVLKLFIRREKWLYKFIF